MASSFLTLAVLSKQANVSAVKSDSNGGALTQTKAMESARSIVLAMEQGQNWTDTVRASLASVPSNERTGEFSSHCTSEGLIVRNGKADHWPMSSAITT